MCVMLQDGLELSTHAYGNYEVRVYQHIIYMYMQYGPLSDSDNVVPVTFTAFLHPNYKQMGHICENCLTVFKFA